MRRADIARKCARFCQLTCWTSISRRYASLTSAVACRLWPARSPGHAPAGDAAQFAVDDGNQPLERRLVAVPPRQEESRHIGGVWMNTRDSTRNRPIFG